MTDGATPPTGRDEELQAIHAFVDLVVASSRSPQQRDRMSKAAGVPVTLAGTSMLRIVERHGPIVLGDLAARLSLDQSTVSRQVRALEEVGLVERTSDPADGRSSLIAMSAEGKRLRTRVRAVARNDYDAALADWTDDDRQQLARLLDRFRQALLAAQVDDHGWSRPREASR